MRTHPRAERCCTCTSKRKSRSLLEKGERITWKTKCEFMKLISSKIHQIRGKNNSHPQKYQNPGTDQTDLCGCSIYIVRESSELTFWCLKVEKPRNVHHHFQKLLTELKKSTDAYELSVANKLYGRKDFPFLQVSFLVCHTFGLHPGSLGPIS